MSKQIFDFDSTNILIIGVTCLDTYWHGDIHRVSPEAPVPVTHYKKSEYRLSGAGLIASIISKVADDYQPKVKLISPIAANSTSQETNNKIIELLVENNIALSDDSLVRVADNTANQIRIVGQAQQLLNIDNKDLIVHDLELFNQVVGRNLLKYKTVIFYDDGSNTINNQYLKDWLQICAVNNITTIYMPDYSISTLTTGYIANNLISKSNAERGYEFDYIVYNQNYENLNYNTVRHLNTHILLLDHKDKRLKFFDKYNEYNFFVDEPVIEIENMIGSSEALLAIFALAINTGKSNRQAVELANSSLNWVVRHFGQEVFNQVELQLAYSDYYLNYQYSFLKLKQEINACRARNETIVFANGCFDVLHVGHVAYLEAAKQKGDRLIVAVNSDCSIKKLKGANRPINNLNNRLYVLSQMQCVDWVVPFFTDTPNGLLQWLQPDILVKGGDYTLDGVVGREIVEAYGGKVEVIKHSFIERSSTKIIEKISSET